MNRSLVSVVVPTYNRADLITDALDSVYQQTYRPIELLIIDDGSTDSTPGIVQQWTLLHQKAKVFDIKYIKQTNQGGNPARNNGIQNATADFIAFLDSDDCWHPEKINLQLQRFINKNVGAVYCGVRHILASDGTQTEPSGRVYPEGDLLKQLLVKDVTAPTSTYLVRKKVFDAMGAFDTSLQARQDWDMWIRVAKWGKIHAVPRPLVDYRTHEGERTASNPMKEVRAYQRIREKYKLLIRQQPFSVQAASKAAYCKRMGRVHFHHNISRTKAFRYYIQAIYWSPLDFDNWAAFIGFFLPGKLRRVLHKFWNKKLGRTIFAIRSH